MQASGELQWTRTDAVRRWLTASGVVVGPVILVLSILVNYTAPTDSLRAGFNSMAEHPELVVLEALLETLGFTLVLAALAGATVGLRGRGGALGTWGAALAILGIVGFSFSNATGFMLAELAQIPDHDAGFATASTLMSSSIAGSTGAIGMLLEVAGQLGILLVIGGLVRARLVRFRVLFLVLAGIVVNFALGTMVGTLIADLLLLAVGIWLAISILRVSREKWLGVALTAARKHTEVAA